MSEKQSPGLNPWTVQLLEKAGSREAAFAVLESMCTYVDGDGVPERMRACIRDGTDFNGGKQAEGYFRYLQMARVLLEELYPPLPP